MTFLPDTNVWSLFLRGKDPALTARLRAVADADIRLCSVVKAELLYGAHKGGRPSNFELLSKLFGRFVSLPFDDLAAEHYGRIRAPLSSAGNSIGANDLMIAAIAVANGLTVVTHNVREFRRVPTLVVEDWQSIP